MIIEQIASGLGLPVKYVQKLSNAASHHYKSYLVKKKNGGFRTIDHPSRRLKAVQQWILRNVLSSLPIHDAALGYRQGISIFDNAAIHAQSRFLLRLDLENFFPSITADDFAHYVASAPHQFHGWTEQDIRCVSNLLFRKGKLTIGAPTSPALSNALCMTIDSAIAEMCRRMKLKYSRYADDLFFSSNIPNVLVAVPDEVRTILRETTIPANLRLNAAKTIHSSKKRNRMVTGITLGSDAKPHVPRSYKRLIRSMIYKFSGLNDQQKGVISRDDFLRSRP